MTKSGSEGLRHRGDLMQKQHFEMVEETIDGILRFCVAFPRTFSLGCFCSTLSVKVFVESMMLFIEESNLRVLTKEADCLTAFRQTLNRFNNIFIFEFLNEKTKFLHNFHQHVTGN